MSRITIKDLARYLNINPSTVSRALRNHPDVSTKVKDAVHQLADKLGYKPNHAAINLRSGKSGTIALIIPEISTYFFPNVIKAVEEVIHRRGYNLLILHSNDDLGREIQNAEICGRMGVEGILVSLTRESADIEHFQDLLHSKTPIVFFDKISPNSFSYNVTIPGEKATYEGVIQMLKPYRKGECFCAILGDERLSITQDRLRGVNKAIAERQIKSSSSMIKYAPSAKAAFEIVLKLMGAKQKPDYLFVMSDEILEGVMRAIHMLGVSVPQDLKLLVMSDGFLPDKYNYPIPYIYTSGYELGLAASQLLFRLMDGELITEYNHFIDTPLLEPKLHGYT